MRPARPQPKPTIVVAEDDPGMARLISRTLELEGFRPISATDGLRAIKLVESSNPVLVLLDIMMPGMDGFEVCRQLRQFTDVPIIMVTARDQEEDVVRGLNAGADDYLTKPFGTDELVARVRAVLRRARPQVERLGPPFTYEDLVVDFAQCVVRVRGEPVGLTPTEYRLLSYLARHAGKVISTQELLTRVWGAEYRNESHILQVNIARLRQKLEPDPRAPRYIITRAGLGYMVPRPPGPEPAPT